MGRFSPVTALPGLFAGLLVLAYFTINTAVHVLLVSAAAMAIYLLCLSPEPRRDMGARALLIVTLMPVIAWTLHTPWLLHGIMLVWVPLFARGTGGIVPVYLLSLLLLPGLDEKVMIGELRLFDLGVHDALGIGSALALLCNRGRNRPGLRLDLPACAMILLLAAALARDTSFSNLLRSTSNVMLDLGLPYYITSRGLRDLPELRRALLWLGGGGMTVGAILIYEASRAWPIYHSLYDQYQVVQQIFIKSRGGMLRAAGPFLESTSMAMVLALCALAIWACRREFRSGRHYALVLAIALVGLAPPQSRGAWMGLAFGMILGELYLGRYVSLVKSGLLAVVGLAGLLLAAIWSPNLSETLGLSGGASETSDYRRQLFERGMQEFWDSPLIGFSVPTLNIRLGDLRQGEGIIDFVNAYIWIMLISGGLGLVIFAGVFLYYMGNMRRYRKLPTARLADKELAAFIFAGLCMMMLMLVFTSFGTRPAMFVFVLFGLSSVYAGMRGKPATAREATLVPLPDMALGSAH